MSHEETLLPAHLGVLLGLLVIVMAEALEHLERVRCCGALNEIIDGGMQVCRWLRGQTRVIGLLLIVLGVRV